MSGGYKHLGLTDWPFRVVPERSLCTYIADRERLRGDVADLLAGLARRDASDIHLFWAWFGAGKTHTLFYLANRAAQIGYEETNNALHTVYSEFPKGARSFLDMYRSFVTGLEVEKLVDAFLEVSTSEGGAKMLDELTLALPDLMSALQVMATGDRAERLTSIRWLRAENLPIAMFRKLSISSKISSSEDATHILAQLVHLLRSAAVSAGRPGCNVVWLIDEFQRIDRTAPRAKEEINSGLHSTFNACPSGLSLFFSFSGKPQTALPAWFSPELRDRIGRTKVLILPPMLRDEALTFARDVIAHFRMPSRANLPPYFPFSAEACRAIIDEVNEKDELKPRSIMLAFDAVLREADARLQAKEFETVSESFARKALAEYTVLEEPEE